MEASPRRATTSQRAWRAVQLVVAMTAATAGYFTVMWFDGPGGITQESPSTTLQVLAQVWVLATLAFFGIGWRVGSTRWALVCVGISFALFVGYYYAHLAERVAVPTWLAACDDGDGRACYALAGLHWAGHGVAQDADHASELDMRACTLGHASGCGRLAREGEEPWRGQACQVLRTHCQDGSRGDCEVQGKFCGAR